MTGNNTALMPNADSEDAELRNQASTYSMIMGLVTETDPKEWE